jgi:phospholipase C
MPEQLEARKISWKSYTEAVGQFDNPFPAFRQFRNNAKLNALGIKPTYPNDFTADLNDDALPSVSWVQLSFLDSEHAANPPGKGEAAVDRFLRLLWKYPKIWKKTAVIINYDENGGFFDHVAPPTPPKGTKGEFLTTATLPASAGGVRGPIGLGFRVPCIVVSPWTRGGYVSSDVFDHTSVLKLIEKRFGAEVPHISAWRRKTVGDLTSAFNFAAKPDASIPKLPATSATAPDVTTGECAPGTGDPPPYPVPSTITFPKQKSGKAKRPSGIV